MITPWTLLLLLLPLTGRAAHSPPFDPAGAATAIATALRNSSGGATVARGAYSFFFLKDCAEARLPSCFALNAASPCTCVCEQKYCCNISSV